MIKTFVRILALIIVSLPAYSQESDPTKSQRLGTQNQIVALEVVSKIATIPISLGKRVYHLFTKSYSDYERDFYNSSHIKTTELKGNYQIFAYNQNYTSPSAVGSFEKFLAGEYQTTKAQKCEEVCPNSFEILRMNKEQLRPVSENFPSFRNVIEDFEDSYIKQSGYCWGHTTVMDDFHYLAFFDPNNKSGTYIPDANIDRKAYIEFYKDLIDQVVLKGNATIIPGFANLRELSTLPELKSYLKKRVAFKWAKNGVKLRSFGNLIFDGNKMKDDRREHFIQETTKRLLSNQTPRIIFAALGESKYSHVLNIYGTEKLANGTHRFYVLETNYFPEDIKNEEPPYIDIDVYGNATYPYLKKSRIHHERIGKIKYTFEEEQSEIEYVHALNNFCKKITSCE